MADVVFGVLVALWGIVGIHAGQYAIAVYLLQSTRSPRILTGRIDAPQAGQYSDIRRASNI